MQADADASMGNKRSLMKRNRNRFVPPSPLVTLAKLASSGEEHANHFNSRGLKERNDDDLRPLRIEFYTEPLATSIQSEDALTKARGNTIINNVLPAIQRIWGETLSVIPSGPLVLPPDVCFDLYNFPSSWSTDGLEGADLLIFVSAFNAIGETQLCSTDSSLSTLAVSSPCAIDPDSDRPVVGFANVCLNTLSATNGEVDDAAIETMIDIMSHELVHVLGMNSELFKYFRNGVTGEHLTTRKTNLLGVSTGFNIETAKCVNGQNDLEISLPCDNTVVYKEEAVTYGTETVNRGFYEIVLPTVRQVARNQFKCQTLEGARLENQPTSTDCLGSHFDERTWFTEFMSAVYDEDAAYFSPLTLALLEDSGWYKVDFTYAENSPFGLGAGCEFATGDCIVDDAVPDYGKGFFCADMSGDWSCGPSHHYRGGCDLNEYIFPQRTYFDTTHIGPSFTHADWCPLVVDDNVDCDDPSATKLFADEVFNKDSKCLDVTVDGNRAAMCLISSCNEENQTFDFGIGGNLYSCTEDFEVINVDVSGSEYKFDCPRLTQVCPSMFCPAMCSGKGVCNWYLENPICQCFDINDKTVGCYDSKVNQPKTCRPSASWRISLSSFSLGIPLLVLVSQL